MGNICSSPQKHCKDADSDMSEGGDNVSESAHISTKTDIPQEKVSSEPTNNKSTPVANYLVTPRIDVNEFRHQTNCNEIEKIHKNDCSKPNVSSIFNKTYKRNRKIALYIVVGRRHELKKQMSIVNQLLPDLSKRCQAKEFELTVSFTLHENIGQHKNDNLSRNDLNHSLLSLHEEMENCFNEIKRHKDSYIVPILFFGSTMEKPIIPRKISHKDLIFLLSISSKEQSNLIQKFYKADILSKLGADFTLASYSSLKEEETEQILETFITLMPIHLKITYLTSAVEKVITNIILNSKTLTKQCIWVQYDGPCDSSSDSPLILSEMSSRHVNLNCQLKDEISVQNIIVPLSSANEIEDISDLLEDVLKTNIDRVIHEHLTIYQNSRNTLGICRQIVEEFEAVQKHSIVIGTNCTAGAYDVEGVLKYIRSDSLHPLVIYARPEEGKGFLASQVALNLEKWTEDFHFVLRYARLTVISSEITSMLASIADQISIIVDGRPCHTQHEVHHYKRTIERLLEKSNVFIIIFIDSADEIVEESDYNWLPKFSKPNAKIILTITNNNTNLSENPATKKLLNLGVPKENLISLLYFSSNTKSEKNLPPYHGSNPFEDKLILKLSSLGVQVDSNNCLEKLIEILFVTLESKIDVNFLEVLLVILAISPYGVYETDCINIFEEHTNINRVCSLTIWSKFCWILDLMLIHTNYIKIMDSVFQDSILKRYQDNIHNIQNTTKRYYENQPDSFYDYDKKCMSFNAEKFLKVPQHDYSILSGCAESILENYFTKHYFTDLSWMSNKIASTGCFQYLYDIIVAEKKIKSTAFPHIELIKQFLTQHMTQLNYDGSQFYTLFKVFLMNSIAKEESLNSNDYVKNWMFLTDQLKITHLVCLSNYKKGNISDGTETYNEVAILNEPGHFVAALSTDYDEISVWDLYNCKKIRVIKSVPQPSLLCSIRNFKVAVLCKREIKVIDLQNGQYMATLKGVMNQKMPYFGLHDDDHLVCLSRNRMYVNLMNLKTGDCVTSFKAGEDRFLNSLIVSGNGRILVCGDESQKPFSLLVWHLSQRRLLYDLRIPHHDLFTALSAITYEGLYVCVVAKEIKEPGPNFIVVYDLQSGTLFQKLKPVVNTVALAISQANGCVIAGLENADILIWDLVTGNCRHTLIGHNAPVTLMKVDPLGSCLLSGDKDGRDLSLRLWELSTGKPLAVYSAPKTISSCEILDNGIFIILTVEETPGVLILQLKNNDISKTVLKNVSHESVECKLLTLKEP